MDILLDSQPFLQPQHGCAHRVRHGPPHRLSASHGPPHRLSVRHGHPPLHDHRGHYPQG